MRTILVLIASLALVLPSAHAAPLPNGGFWHPPKFCHWHPGDPACIPPCNNPWHPSICGMGIL